MEKIRDFFSRFQFVYQRTRNITKIVVILALVLCTGALITLRLATMDLENRTGKLYDRAVALDQENEELREDINKLGSVQSVVEIAEEELGLVQPGTVIYQSETEPESNNLEEEK
jgi:cell division protein FtsB